MQPQILLVHNRFCITQPVTWLSYFIRVFTCSKWNHLAVKVGAQVVESVGRGVVVTPYADWHSKADRIVLPLVPIYQVHAERVFGLKGKPYGFLDLLQIARKIRAERWQGKEWRGKNFGGYLCSEVGGVLLGVKGLISPADFEHLPGLVRGEEYETKKK